MSRKTDIKTANLTDEVNYRYQPSQNTENKGRAQDLKTILIKGRKGETKQLFNNGQKCDALWITPFADTTCCIRTKVCTEKKCTEKWIKMERHFSRASKVVTLHNGNENCVNVSNGINTSENLSNSGINENKLYHFGNTTLLKSITSKKRKKSKGDVLPGASSNAITQIFSSPSIVVIHYLLLGKKQSNVLSGSGKIIMLMFIDIYLVVV